MEHPSLLNLLATAHLRSSRAVPRRAAPPIIANLPVSFRVTLFAINVFTLTLLLSHYQFPIYIMCINICLP